MENNFFTWKERYKIMRGNIGKGSFSKVYKAFDLKTDGIVAIKKVGLNGLNDHLKKRLFKELEILQKVEHENIIKYYDFVLEDNHLYIITEYCEGGDITNVMSTILNENEILEMMKQIIEGMYYLHCNKIAHRDIKPQNILLKNGVVKICDFGFSSIINDENNLSSTICGSPLYMSPQLLYMKEYNAFEADIWSLGILFYTMVYKSHPYGPLLSIEMYRNALKSSIRYPASNYSPILAQFIKSFLQKDPKARITIADAINHQLWKEVEETKKDEEYDIFDMDDFSTKLASDINTITSNLQQQDEVKHDKQPIDFSPLTPPNLNHYPFKKPLPHSFETTAHMVGLIDKYYEDNYFIKPEEDADSGSKAINIVDKTRVSDKICGFLKNSYEIMISSLGFKTL